MIERKLIMPFIQGEIPTNIEVEKAVKELYGHGFMMGDPAPRNFIKNGAGSVVPVDFGLVFGTNEYLGLPAQIKTEIVHDYVKGGHHCVKGGVRDHYTQVMREMDESLGDKSPTRRINVKVLLKSGLF
ncbi:hypothetical protein [Pseudomonas gingeri]|nr:hypothetical protein [Pseudomonas gingeri]NWD03740.1 hypothetical protein [Pseudomonas gingeri]NWD48085.1 hypothetical protein [Pseudomonas gingeri]NWE33538.1 hypothetical protein [Pseudomonas gingeri]NWE58549.1 hypothetical protein [Pseudomonas gingeri]NWE99882.1 hypothetical protein [Pseudomonas gingeri]